MNVDYSFTKEKDYFDFLQKKREASTYFSETKSNRIRKNQAHVINSVLICRLSEKANLTLFGNFDISQDNEIYNSNTNQNLNPGNIRGVYNNDGNTKYANAGLYMDWGHGDKGSKIELAADKTVNNNHAISYSRSTSDANGKLWPDALKLIYVFPSETDIYSAEVKYTLKFGNELNVSYGLNASQTTISTENSYQYFGDRAPASFLFNYNYKENILGAFVSHNGSIKEKLDYKIGLRTENTQMFGIVKDDEEQTFSRKLFNVFPNVFLGIPFDDKKEDYLSVSFRISISRPNFRELNPYRFFVGNNLSVAGNPSLSPALTRTANLSYNHKQVNFVYNYSNSKNQIAKITSFSDSTATVTTLKENLSAAWSHTLGFSTSFNPFGKKWWSSNLNTSVTYRKLLSRHFTNSGAIFIGQLYNDFIINKQGRLETSYYYSSGNIIYNIKTKPYSGISMGFKWLINSNTTLSCTLYDIFLKNSASQQVIYDKSSMHQKKLYFKPGNWCFHSDTAFQKAKTRCRKTI